MSNPLHASHYADTAEQCSVPIVENVCLARDTYRVRFRCPEIACRVIPGQFVMLRLAKANDPLIGRALAVYDVVSGADGSLSDEPSFEVPAPPNVAAYDIGDLRDTPGKELLLQAIEGREVDRVPWVPFSGVHSASLIGADATTFLKSSELIVRGQSEAIRRYRGHTDTLHSVDFSPDGQRVLSGGQDGLMIEWRIDDTLEELVSWTEANRHLPELTCSQRDQFNIEPLCE